MRIAVLGTGMVGRALAGRWDELGHEVRLGTRDPERTRAALADGGPLADWIAGHPAVTLASFADAAGRGEVVVNATSGTVTLDALGAAGEANLAGKVLIDVSNPLDFSAGMPPTLFVKDTDSLGEVVQRSFPAARVVKTLNTLNADLMVHPEALAEATSVFVSGDDAEAKTVVVGLLQEFGHSDVIDLGGIETARGPELWLPLWLRLMGALGTASFNLKIVR